MAKGEFITVRGVLNYAKLTGAARPHTGLPKYDKGPYWSLNITPDEKSIAILKKNGIDGKLKEPSEKDKARVGDGKFLDLRVLENRPDGTKNNPPTVKDIAGKDWDGRNIGNGSIADVNIKVVDYGKASDKGTYLQAVRVLRLVPYEVEAFAPLSKDDEFFGASDEVAAEEDTAIPTSAFETDLDDDVPFNSGN